MVLALGVVTPSAAQPPAPAPTELEYATELLDTAKSFYDDFQYKDAMRVLSEAIARLAPSVEGAPQLASLYFDALALRGRIHVMQQDHESARADFRQILSASPSYALAGPANSTPVTLFSQVKKLAVGEVEFDLQPPDATLEIDGKDVGQARFLPLLPKAYVVTARRVGYEPARIDLSLTAGQVLKQSIALTRVASVVFLISSPPGVEVLVNAQARGATQPGPPGAQWAENQERIPLGEASAEFVLEGVKSGDLLVARKPCYETRRYVLEKVDDLSDSFRSIRLPRAEGTVAIEGPGGAEVFVDGQRRGILPVEPLLLCEGEYRLELKSPLGRFQQKLQITAGQAVSIAAQLHPAVAILNHFEHESYVGSDARAEIATRVVPKDLVLLVPPDADVLSAMGAGAIRLQEGFLAYDLYRRPSAAPARGPTPQALRDGSEQLARALGVQALAEIRLAPDPGPDRSRFLLAVLAAGSALPDVVEIDIGTGGAESVFRALAALNASVELRRPSIGVTVADVPDVGLVVSSVAHGTPAEVAGIAPGDVLTGAGGQGLPDAKAFYAVLQTTPEKSVLPIVISDRKGVSRGLTLSVGSVPLVVSATDESLPFNVLIAKLRTLLIAADDPVARLNLAVALMAVKSWDAALAELQRVSLPTGPSVSQGTVTYLKGECLSRTGRLDEARQLWQSLSADSDGLLTADGPPVKELAERSLAGPVPGSRR